MSFNTSWGTPARSRNLRIVSAEACHHLTCNFRSVRLIAPGLFVRKSRTTRPISKLDQSSGFSVFAAASRKVLLSKLALGALGLSPTGSGGAGGAGTTDEEDEEAAPDDEEAAAAAAAAAASAL